MDVLGTSVKTSMNTEDRDLFVKELNKVDLKVPVSHACENMEEAVAAARNIGYPIMIRSAYALGRARFWCLQDRRGVQGAGRSTVIVRGFI